MTSESTPPFCPDGEAILTASGDGTARVWPATPEGWFELANRCIQRDARR